VKLENPADFREVHTHEAAKAIVKDILETHGSKLGAKITEHKYESTSPHGAIHVAVEKHGTFQVVRYGLPDDRDELRKFTLATLEPAHEWKGRHQRDY
jgi:hypothetical protein